MPSTTWSGFLSFGLIMIPIRLSPAARTERISFNQLHKDCHTRLKQPLFCPTCNRQVDRSEVEKGYEYEKGQYLLFTQEEIDQVEPESAKSMEILEFVKIDEIDPLYFDASYYARPDEGGEKAYQLLREAMEKSGYAGVAKVSMHNRENIVIIRPAESGLTLHTMFYSSEIREAESAGAPKAEVKDAERKLAQQLIENLSAKFDPEKYKDTYQEGLQMLIDAKAKGQEITATPREVRPQVIDLMEALKKSLADKRPRTEKAAAIRIVPRAAESSAAPAPTKRRKAG